MKPETARKLGMWGSGLMVVGFFGPFIHIVTLNADAPPFDMSLWYMATHPSGQWAWSYLGCALAGFAIRWLVSNDGTAKVLQSIVSASGIGLGLWKLITAYLSGTAAQQVYEMTGFQTVATLQWGAVLVGIGFVLMLASFTPSPKEDD